MTTAGINTDTETKIALESFGVSTQASALENVSRIEQAMSAVEAAGGGVVTLYKPGVYLLSEVNATLRTAIAIPSKTTFILGEGVTLKLANSANCYIVRNRNPVSGDTDIRLVGGTLDGNRTTQSGDNSGANPYYGFAVLWENVTRLYHGEQTINDVLQFCVNARKLNQATFEGFVLNSTKDGIHLNGTNSFVTIRRIKGSTKDNTVAFFTSVGTFFSGSFRYADGSTVTGNINHILIEDIEGNDTNGPVRFGGAAGETISHVTIRSIRGTQSSVSLGAVQIIDDIVGNIIGATIRNVLVEDIRTVITNGTPQVNAKASGLKDLCVRNVFQSPSSEGVKVDCSLDSLLIDGVFNAGVSNLRSVEICESATTHIRNGVIQNVIASPPNSTTNTIVFGSLATWDNMYIDGVLFRGTSSAAIIRSNNTTRQPLDVGTVIANGGSGVFDGSLDVYAGNVRTANQSFICQGGARLHAAMMEATTAANMRANGQGSISSSSPMKEVYHVNFSSLTSAATSQSITLGSLPRGAAILRAFVKPVAAFTGGALSNMIGRLRYGSTQIGTDINLFSAPGFTAPTVFDLTAAPIQEAINANLSLNLLFVSTGANVNTATAGRISIGIEYTVFGVEH